MTLKALRPSQQLIDIVASIRGVWHGNYAMARCPAHADREPSLSLRQGDRGILVHCFAGCSNEDVLRELRQIDPVRDSPHPDYRPGVGDYLVIRLWEQGSPIEGSLAERYLLQRRVPTDLQDIRFHPRCPHKPKPWTEFKPALLVAVREGLKLVAVQRIFIDPETGHRTEKVMLGRPGQGAWRPDLRGASELAIAEGMEDAAGFTRQRGVVAWASLGAERLHLLSIPNHVRKILIAEDDNKPGLLGAEHALKVYRKAGLTVERCSPRPWEDWAEVNENN